jgi:hypothetical protein
MYFTYWDVKDLAWAGAPAIIALNGKRDAKYEFVKRINGRIARLGPTLTKLVSTGAYCNDPVPPGARPLPDDAPVKKAEGGPLLIGCFRDAKGLSHILVVNRSFKAKFVARLTLDAKVASFAEISPATGRPTAAQAASGRALEIPLDPGEGRLGVLGSKK